MSAFFGSIEGLRRVAAVLLVGATMIATGQDGMSTQAEETARPSFLSLFPVVPEGRERKRQERPACDHALCGRLKRQIEAGCSAATDLPYADTVFLRRALEPAIPDTLAQALVLANMASDPAFASTALTPFLAAEDPVSRYVAALTLVLAHHQNGLPLDGPALEPAFRAMEEAEPALSFPASDRHFAEGLRWLDRGNEERALTALEQAIDREPRFFNALALALKLQLQATIGAERAGPSLCRVAYDKLLGLASGIMDIEPCAQQAAHLDIFLRRDLADPARTPAYRAVEVYVALISRRRDVAVEATDAFSTLSGPRCSADVGALLRQLLAETEAP
ncbi:MAG: hypothetical protein AAGD40_10200 [Pseudomonadota bacterium]